MTECDIGITAGEQCYCATHDALFQQESDCPYGRIEELEAIIAWLKEPLRLVESGEYHFPRRLARMALEVIEAMGD